MPVVVKRDGCQTAFNENRIRDAILKAAIAANVNDSDYCSGVARVVSNQMAERESVDIHEIQNSVENQLMAGPYKKLAISHSCATFLCFSKLIVTNLANISSIRLMVVPP